ncbi:K+-transporting ATPase ATPase C chain [Amycolatopsis jiangsuensis]|uniref:Potassium-transporting ATPase KdpC subunit n=2 Tax=Amycolatopsis jiangsuensis TaxID=1181879 RepID=A0A840IVW6_9PSEU|nr:potassium-transporting ATPase subunit C [Amycolatopsis jiangsuensis]MBB4685352.1 K+-transporting ATPase ATPase C chain [Amycolatopsis jiangsuensis]
MRTPLNQAWAGLRLLVAMTILLGLLYPLAVWGAGRIPGLRDHAEGSLVTQDGRVAGSSLIGIDPVPADPAHDPWFHTRPSAAPEGASGGSNQGPFTQDLVKTITERKDRVAAREGVAPSRVPADAVTASASGLDPSISVAYADLQIPRVARVTGLPEGEVRRLVGATTTGAGIGVPGVNVLLLNLAVRSAVPGAH